MTKIDRKLVSEQLEKAIKSKKTMTYTEIVNHFGLPPLDGHWKSHPLCSLFELIDQEDAKEKRPFKTAIVVSSKEQKPGTGLFEALERLKKIPDPKTPEARDKIWVAELNAVFKYKY
ncbi:hypothetical protein [Acinetobacter sp. ANC 4639]